MTIPLVLLSVFAVSFGWIGIPETFPLLGRIFNYNYFHHFVGATIEEALIGLNELGIAVHELETITVNWAPLLVSVVVALGGLFFGWWVYGRKPLEAGEEDPLVRPLGPAFTFLYNKWYWDELYQVAFVQPVEWFSETFVYQWVDKGVIDGTLHIIALTVYRLGQYMKRFEEVVISGGVDWVKDQFLEMARDFRTIQTGKLQEYALVSAGIASVLALLILGINFGWFNVVIEWWNSAVVNVILPLW
jgi:NADH-quinone oxidoreductase subunit L